jgi:hypothetical protein
VRIRSTAFWCAYRGYSMAEVAVEDARLVRARGDVRTIVIVSLVSSSGSSSQRRRHQPAVRRHRLTGQAVFTRAVDGRGAPRLLRPQIASRCHRYAARVRRAPHPDRRSACRAGDERRGEPRRDAARSRRALLRACAPCREALGQPGARTAHQRTADFGHRACCAVAQPRTSCAAGSDTDSQGAIAVEGRVARRGGRIRFTVMRC